ncbi:MAG: hypothetical protein L6R37_003256 [Teloschistes peruensis]|nr:MAG: hypothetical protein L6R37_003256 [Teloschistes peruensis]
MTEPEELDEDLFADLYDADEPTAAAAPPAQPAPEPEAAEPTSLATDAPPLYENGQDGNPDASTYMTDQTQNAFTDGQEDKDNSRWDNDGRGSRMDVVAQDLTRGTDAFLNSPLAGCWTKSLGSQMEVAPVAVSDISTGIPASYATKDD